MRAGDKLPPQLTWQPDGHVSDVALTSIADGEVALVIADALDHVESCDHCTGRLGESALRSIESASVLSGYAQALAAKPVVAQPAARGIPFRVIAVALGIAAAGAAPGLFDTAMDLPATIASLTRMVPVLLKSVVTISHGAGALLGGWVTLFIWLSAGLLMMTGLGVARALPRKQAVQGGM
jgi:hypothetical protein